MIALVFSGAVRLYPFSPVNNRFGKNAIPSWQVTLCIILLRIVWQQRDAFFGAFSYGGAPFLFVQLTIRFPHVIIK